MNREQQREHWYKFHRFLKRYEKIYASKFNQALKQQIKQFTDSGTLHAVTSSPVYYVVHNLYQTVSPIYAAASTVGIRRMKARSPIGFNERIISLMRSYYGIDFLNISEGITETTKEQIQRVLSEAAQEGWSFSEIVSRLQAPDITASRARLIARTETVTAANAASSIAAKETGLMMDKVWISAQDNRTRRTPRDEFDHLHMNGRTVGMNDNFLVNGEELSFPGDRTSASAGNYCNCRCTHAFIPKRDASGRLIRA